MIIIEVRIKRSLAGKRDEEAPLTEGATNATNKYVYEIQTKPSLEDIWTDLLVMVDMFIASVSKVRKIDDMVIPLLKMKKNTLIQFDKGKNSYILNQSKLINSVIEAMRSQPELKMSQLKAYQAYLEMNFDALLLDLKMKTYAEQNQNNSQDLREEGGMDEPEETLEADAYNDIEISDRVYIQAFADLRKAFWDVQLDIDS